MSLASSTRTEVAGDDERSGDAERGAGLEGRTIGRYQLRRRLGSGGGGSVYAAEDPELDRELAVKLIRSDERQGRGAARLLREAQALARLSHANVITVLDVGHRDDFVFIAMELVDGESLDAWREARHEWREVIDVFIQAARGLQAAHEAGIVHRDFKPSNVMIDAAGRVRVLDFGLARSAHEPLAWATVANERRWKSRIDDPMTRTDALVGTPLYMAPEQFQGDPTTPATDQFAFCLSLYEALYGSNPYPTDSLADRVVAVTEGDALTPNLASVPNRLWPVIRRGLLRRPGDRWPSMSALIDALERARRPGTWRWFAVLGAAGLSVALARPGALASSPDAVASAAPLTSAGAIGTAAELRALRIQLDIGQYEDVLPKVEAVLAEAEAAGDLNRVPELLILHGYALYATGKEAEAKAAYERAYAEGTERKLDLVVATAATHLARLRRLADDLPGAHEWLRYAESALERKSTGIVSARVHLEAGSIARRENDLVSAEASMREALRLAQESGVATSLQQARIHNRLASVLRDANRTEEAAAEYEASLALQREILGENHRSTAGTMMNVAVTRLELGDRQRGLPRLRRACAALTAAGADLEELVVCNANLGLLEAEQENRVEARAHLERALELQKKQTGPEHPRTATIQGMLATVLMWQEDYDGAVAHFERAIATNEAILGTDHPSVLELVVRLGAAYRRAGNPAASRDHLERALAVYRTLEDHQASRLVAEASYALVSEDDAALDILNRVVAHPSFSKVLPRENSRIQFERAKRMIGNPATRKLAISLARASLTQAESLDLAPHDERQLIVPLRKWLKTHG